VKEFLTPKEVAERLQVSVQLLWQLRNNGGGPPYYKFGGRIVRYCPEQLDEWAKSITFTCTEQERAKDD
jgi:predicted DNA-binding transcriptional regulator AlpA